MHDFCRNTVRAPISKQITQITWFLTCLAAVTAFATEPKPEGGPKTVAAVIDDAPTVTFTSCPDEPQIVAAYSEREPQWWGRLKVFHRKGDVIVWEYAFPEDYEEYRGHYVVRFRWVRLKQIAKPVLEVIESTHMGNGSLLIWAVEGRKLRLLLDTKVRGRFWSVPEAFGVPVNGEARFEGDHLSVEYRHEADESSDVVSLTGTVAIQDLEGRALPSRRYDQICVWDAAKRIFVAQSPKSP